MPPRSTDVPSSTLKIRPVPNRCPGQDGDSWLKDRQLIDGAEGLWRVHDGLYDLAYFIQKHPGGSEWIELTKGTDITEAFEVHHLNNVDDILKKYYVRDAKTKRNVPYTFKDDGFYRTLKREVREILKTFPKQSERNTAFFTDMLLFGMFFFGILANMYQNYWLGALSGLILALVTIAAHNYFHQKDNVRMHYFTFSLMQTREWRISHVLSHHLHTNTINDLEIMMVEPFVEYLPIEKSWIQRYLSWLLFPLLWPFGFHVTFIKRMYNVAKGQIHLLQWYDLIPFTLPLAMYLFTDQTLLATLLMWNFMIMIASFHLYAVGLNAAHHHPDIFHDGDMPRSTTDYDWGLSQLDAVMDRKEITGSHFLVLTNFGDHALHHLFPTLDHGTLEFIYPTFKKVCEQFGVNVRMTSQLEMIKGHFLQVARIQPNPSPPDLFKKY